MAVGSRADQVHGKCVLCQVVAHRAQVGERCDDDVVGPTASVQRRGAVGRRENNRTAANVAWSETGWRIVQVKTVDPNSTSLSGQEVRGIRARIALSEGAGGFYIPAGVDGVAASGESMRYGR